MSTFFQQVLMRICLAGLAALLVASALRTKIVKAAILKLTALFREMTALGRTVAAVLLCVFFIYGSVKTNAPSMSPRPYLGALPMLSIQTVTEEEIARGYRVDSVTNCAPDVYTMPDGVIPTFNWHLRGTFGEWARLDLGDFAFPVWTNGETVSSFSVFNDGRIRPTPRDAAHEICAVGVPMLAMQGASRFWTADGAGGSKLLTWENFFLNADTNSPVSAQIELSPNGDFATRSNALETVYRRVNPHDWDGDGLANEIDANPYESDGDFFGTGVGWLNVNCAGVLSAVTNGQGEVEITWHTNANPNAYYWLDLTATGALGVAKITATCDGESNLGDLAVIARTNKVCRVPLLVGATYTVESDLPISYSAVSSEHASIFTNSEHSLVVSFPLEFHLERVLTRSGGGPVNYAVSSSPVNVFPDVTAVTGGCCTITCGESCFSWQCLPNCRCVGADHTISVCVGWGGYSRWIPSTIGCDCSHEADHDVNGAAVRVAFAEGAVVFENAYTNAPGDVKTRRSSSTTLSCRVSGGQFGGNVSVGLVDGGRLLRTNGFAVPCSEPVPAGEVVLLTSEYEALSESDTADDIVATAVFTENMTGRRLTSTTTLTSVRVNVSAAANFPTNKIRHVFGPQEAASFAATPVIDGAFWTAGETNVFGSLYNYSAPIVPTNDVVMFSIDSVNFNMNMEIIAPTQLEAIVYEVAPLSAWISNTGDYPRLGDVAAGMVNELKINPDYVSFANLYLQEGECPATNTTGLFERYASGLRVHDEDAGAWREVRVSEEDNRAGTDIALVNFGVIPMALEASSCEYAITNYWYVKHDGIMIGEKHPFFLSTETIVLSDNGNLSVEKYGVTVTRGTNDVATITNSP